MKSKLDYLEEQLDTLNGDCVRGSKEDEIVSLLVILIQELRRIEAALDVTARDLSHHLNS